MNDHEFLKLNTLFCHCGCGDRLGVTPQRISGTSRSRIASNPFQTPTTEFEKNIKQQLEAFENLRKVTPITILTHATETI